MAKEKNYNYIVFGLTDVSTQREALSPRQILTEQKTEAGEGQKIKIGLHNCKEGRKGTWTHGVYPTNILV